MKWFIILFAAILLASVAVQAQINKPSQVVVTGGAIPQDSLDNKVPKADSALYATFAALRDSVYKKLAIARYNADTTLHLTMRWVFVRDSLFRAAQEAAIKVTHAADSLYRAAQEAVIKDTATVKLNRSELPMVFGTAQIVFRDSLQISITGLTTATGGAVVSYLAPDGNIASSDTAASYRINTAAKLTLVGKNGAWFSYWVFRK